MVRRAAGIACGVGTHALFGFTVYHLFRFLQGGQEAPVSGSLGTDALLAVQFVIPHSALLHPAVRSRLNKAIPDAFYGCFYCAVTCLTLLLMFAMWQPHTFVIWRAEGAVRTAVVTAFLLSWVALFYSLSLTGLGYQTGWTQWWHWLRSRPLPRRTFEPRGAYRVLRHPVYLSFLGLLWFTPVMTLDRALLVGVWTLYIAVGSCLKDRRLEFYLGQTYRRYQSQVPGYPGVLFGPLARIPLKPAVVKGSQAGKLATRVPLGT